MNLVLLRHATRSGLAPSIGTEFPLNSVGLAQAEDFATEVESLKALPRPTCLVSSPKLRARQTLLPLARASSLEIKIMAELDERHDNETFNSFEQRIRGVIDLIQKRFAKSKAPTDTIYVCSHLDVLEAAARLWPTDFSERESQATWSTLEYQIFDWRDDILKARTRSRIEPRG